MGLLISIVGSLVRLVVGLVVAAGLVWGGGAFWLLSRDQGDFTIRHGAYVDGLVARTDGLHAGLQAIEVRKVAITGEIAAEEERSRQAAKVIATLHDLESTWDRYIGNPDQQKANADQIRRMEELKTGVQANVDELRREFRRKAWEQNGMEIELANVGQQLEFAKNHDSRFSYYGDLAWSQYKWLIVTAPILFLLARWRLRAFWKRVPISQPAK